MRMRRSGLLRMALGLGWLLCALLRSAPAQETQPPQEALPRLEVNVNRVLVPVVVRDKQGRIVDDLKQDDFEVFDNDKPRPVSAFVVEHREVSPANTPGNTETSSAANSSPRRRRPQPPRYPNASWFSSSMTCISALPTWPTQRRRQPARSMAPLMTMAWLLLSPFPAASTAASRAIATCCPRPSPVSSQPFFTAPTRPNARRSTITRRT